MAKRKAKQQNSARNSVRSRTLRAGCQRTMTLETDLTEIAYRALEYPECPICPHRVDPEGAASFCVWRDVNTPHPFASLAAFEVATETE